MRTVSASTAILAIATSLALASCSATSTGGPETPNLNVTPTEPAATPTPAASPPETVDPADAPGRLQFEAATLEGVPFSGSSLYGAPTVLWFWAPWCPICQADAPAIADAFDELPEGVQLLGVPGRADEESMRAFVAEFGLEGMVQIVDADGSLWSNFSVASQPAIVLISTDGTVRTLPGSIGRAGLLEAARSIA